MIARLTAYAAAIAANAIYAVADYLGRVDQIGCDLSPWEDDQ